MNLGPTSPQLSEIDKQRIALLKDLHLRIGYYLPFFETLSFPSSDLDGEIQLAEHAVAIYQDKYNDLFESNEQD